MKASIDRRRFLQLGSATFVATALGGSSLFAQAEPKKRALKKGYMLNAFPPAKNLKILDKFKLLKAAGFDGVEPNSHLDRAEILQAQEATGLEVASISCGDHTRMFSNQAPSERQKG